MTPLNLHAQCYDWTLVIGLIAFLSGWLLSGLYIFYLQDREKRKKINES